MGRSLPLLALLVTGCSSGQIDPMPTDGATDLAAPDLASQDDLSPRADLALPPDLAPPVDIAKPPPDLPPSCLTVAPNPVVFQATKALQTSPTVMVVFSNQCNF